MPDCKFLIVASLLSFYLIFAGCDSEPDNPVAGKDGSGAQTGSADHSGGYLFSAYRFCPPDSEEQPESCAAAIQILYPTEGEKFSVGDTIPIHYCANPDSLGSVILSVSNDGGVSFYGILEHSSLPTGNQVYEWIVPEKFLLSEVTISGSNCYVKAADYNVPNMYSCLSERFSIDPE